MDTVARTMQKLPATPVDALTVEQLQFHVEQAHQHLRALRRLLPGLTSLSDAERKQANPILDEQHADALGAVIDVMELVPAPFENICDPYIWTEPGQF